MQTLNKIGVLKTCRNPAFITRSILARSLSTSFHAARSAQGFGRAAGIEDTSFLEQSYMKIVGSQVDTKSSDYLQNYEEMMKLNGQLDEIVARTVDVG